jgi:UPF0755 protein
VKLLWATLAVVAVSALLSIAFITGSLFNYTSRDRPAVAEIRVEQGESLAAVVRKLRSQRLIGNERLLLLWARLSGVDTKIHPGLYRFDKSVSAREMLERLATGRGSFYKVTVPEGLTVKEIAGLLAKMEIVDEEKFLTEASAPGLLTALGLPDQRLEGYLFPSTYYFMPGTAEKTVIVAMIDQFRKISGPVLAAADGADGLTQHQLLTLASIIEKESAVEAERPLISAVFHNRLRLGMPLQSDPTVIYGTKNFQGNLTRKHLQETTPYNTYRISGLPPGPISNPGLSSVKAAVEPADVPYLYFVSKNDGTHQFSETLQAHNEAVRTFQPGVAPSSRNKVAARR